MESRDIEFDHLPKRPTSAFKGRRSRALQILINRAALDRVHLHGKSNKRIEVCGVLLGDVYHDGIGPYLHIEAVVEGVNTQGGAGQVTFTSAAWAHIHTTIDRDYPHLRIVGWYHTHPGHGIFLSGPDLFLHENFFGLPWQVALVHDPKSGEDGIFGSVNGTIKQTDFSIEYVNKGAPMSMAIDSLPKMTPVEAPVQKPAAAPLKAPVETPVQKPAPAAVKAPAHVPVSAPAPVKAHVEVPMHIPVPTPFKAHIEAPVEPIASPVKAVEAPAKPVVAIFAPPPVEAPVELAVEMKKSKPLAPKKKTHRVRTAGKVMLAIVGLLLFTATGLLTGLIFQQLGWHLPHWPTGTWPG